MDRQDPAWIAMEYEKRRRASIIWRLVAVPLVIGLAVTLPKDGGADLHVLKVVLGIGSALAIWRIIAIWRCPSCERSLGRDLHTRHCPNCGVRLEL